MAIARCRFGPALIAVLGALAISAPASAAAVAPTAMQPLEILKSGHPVVRVGIDGSEPKRFVIDTAASSTTIMPKLRAEMPGLIAKPSDDALSGAAGRTEVETAVVRELLVSGHRFQSPELMLLPPGPTDGLGVDGILGADIIADFVVEMDMPGRRWRMTRKLEPGMLDGLSASVPFILDDMRAPRLTVRINGVEMPAVLDTGARGTIINWAAAGAFGLSPDSPGLANASDIKGATNHAMKSVEARVDALSIGGAKVQAPKLRIADLPVFQVLGFQPGHPAVILGIDMFADRRFLIDHPGLRLHISPPSPRASAGQP